MSLILLPKICLSLDFCPYRSSYQSLLLSYFVTCKWAWQTVVIQNVINNNEQVIEKAVSTAEEGRGKGERWRGGNLLCSQVLFSCCRHVLCIGLLCIFYKPSGLGYHMHTTQTQTPAHKQYTIQDVHTVTVCACVPVTICDGCRWLLKAEGKVMARYSESEK